MPRSNDSAPRQEMIPLKETVNDISSPSIECPMRPANGALPQMTRSGTVQRICLLRSAA